MLHGARDAPLVSRALACTGSSTFPTAGETCDQPDDLWRSLGLADPLSGASATVPRVGTSPLTNRVGQVFVPVRDMPAAVAWYSALLGLEPGAATHEDRIYDLPAVGDVGISLDAHQPAFTADGPPRFFWWVDDLHAVRGHLATLGVEPSMDVTDIGSVSILQFRDLDGNLLMACQRNDGPQPGEAP